MNKKELPWKIVVWAAALLVSSVFAWIVADIVVHGLPVLSWQFLTTPPLDAGRSGGISTIVVSTGLILAVCLGASLPLGVATAIFLSEFTHEKGTLGMLIRRSLDLLAGVPSIVYGLFGNAFFCVTLKMGFSILSGGLTLACMVLPILIRLTEEGLSVLPGHYRRTAAALAISRRSLLTRVLLPGAAPAIAAGLVLGFGRAIAETAALLFTSGYVDRWPDSLFDSGRALSVHIFDLAMNVPGGTRQAYASALVLIVILIVANGLTSALARSWRREGLQP